MAMYGDLLYISRILLLTIVAGVPYDGSIVDVIRSNSIVLAGIFYGFTSIGLLFVVACLVFNIAFRNKR